MSYAFIFQYILAEAMFVYALPRRRFFVLRLICSLAVLIAMNVLMIELIDVGRDLSQFFFILRLLLSLVLSAVCIHLTFDCPWGRACQCATGGYAVQNLVYNILRLIAFAIGRSYLYFGNFGVWFNVLLLCVEHAVLYIPFFFWIRANRTANERMGIKDNMWAIITAVTVIVVCIFLSARIPRDGVEMRIYSIICCFAVLAIQLGLFERSALKRENAVMEQLLSAEWKHHRQTTEQIELINMKCHDLKHQLGVVSRMNDPDDRLRNAREIEKLISAYDCRICCGNEVMDILLTEKRIYCNERDILFTCIVDGEALSFMSAMDTVALFGNALDNAIQCVDEYESGDRRSVDLSVSRENSMLIVHIENFCSHDVKFEDGVPKTTKSDSSLHGFGVKSMRHIVEKYGGNMTVGLENGIFSVDILFDLGTHNRAAKQNK